MRPVFFKRSGSTILLVVGVIAVLLVTFGVFFRYSVSRSYATKRLNRVLMARELSLSLATLAVHQLRSHEIHLSDSLLRKTLTRPLAQMPANTSATINFIAELKPPLDEILKSSSELRDLRYAVAWQILKSDFQPLVRAYPREKQGQIRISIEFFYKPPGTDATVREEYLYTTALRVTANLVPVLSKFSLYVEDALDSEPASRFNLVSTDVSGNLTGSQFRPWVLNNAADSSLPDLPNRLDDIVSSPRGLVYLGGGNISLGIARAWKDPGAFAEGFHLYNEGKMGSIYTALWQGFSALIFWEAGLSNDISDNDGKMWFDLVKEGFENEAKYNSLFRLMGTDEHRSPTLVLGNVYARTQCLKAFKSDKAANILPFAGSETSFEELKTGASRERDISFLISQIGEMSRAQYNSKYASLIWDQPYNRALGYIISNHRTPAPMSAPEINKTDPLASFINGTATGQNLAHEIPAPFSSIAGSVSDLRSIDRLLTSMQIPGERNAWTINVDGSQSLTQTLENAGFYRNGKLDINGWILVKSSGDLAIDKEIILKSHGGIVIESGSLRISNNIRCESGSCLLNLVTLSGDIIIAENVSDRLDVALTANGQVIVQGNAGATVADIHGSIAMKRIKRGNLATTMARGLNINYPVGLAALPNRLPSEGSEEPILMFAIDWHPTLVE